MFRAHYFLLLIVAVSYFAVGQNTPPVVNAGRDSTTRLGRDLWLWGLVTDDSLLSAKPVTAWTVVDGPAEGLEILTSDIARPRVILKTIGTYRLVLSANDGEFTVTDAVTITVLDSIPFLILTPAAGQKVAPGDSLLITWQIDPPTTPVYLKYSTDSGLIWDNVTVIPVKGVSCMWNVPDTLSPTDSMMIKAQTFFDGRQTPWVSFSLVETGIREHIHGHAHPVLNGKREVFTIDGRKCVAEGSTKAKHPSISHGACIVRTGTKSVLTVVRQ